MTMLDKAVKAVTGRGTKKYVPNLREPKTEAMEVVAGIGTEEYIPNLRKPLGIGKKSDHKVKVKKGKLPQLEIDVERDTSSITDRPQSILKKYKENVVVKKKPKLVPEELLYK